MMKFSAGFIEHREALLVGLGLTDDNLSKMLAGKPVYVESKELQLPEPGFVLGIIASMTFEGIKRQVLEALEALEARFGKTDDKVTIPCMNMADTYYLFPFVNGAGLAAYIVGFQQDRFEQFRRQGFPTFRVRSPQKEFTNVEVLMFWGHTEDTMEESFVAAGLLKQGQKVCKL